MQLDEVHLDSTVSRFPGDRGNVGGDADIRGHRRAGEPEDRPAARQCELRAVCIGKEREFRKLQFQLFHKSDCATTVHLRVSRHNEGECVSGLRGRQPELQQHEHGGKSIRHHGNPVGWNDACVWHRDGI